jgi:hypothetical protein
MQIYLLCVRFEKMIDLTNTWLKCWLKIVFS